MTAVALPPASPSRRYLMFGLLYFAQGSILSYFTALNALYLLSFDVSLAQIGLHVMLIDADLKRPTVHTLLGLEDCRGLADYALEDCPLEDILVHPGLGRLVVLPGGRPIQRSAEVLTSPRMSALIWWVRSKPEFPKMTRATRL